jgi:hypothetical protein
VRIGRLSNRSWHASAAILTYPGPRVRGTALELLPVSAAAGPVRDDLPAD